MSIHIQIIESSHSESILLTKQKQLLLLFCGYILHTCSDGAVYGGRYGDTIKEEDSLLGDNVEEDTMQLAIIDSHLVLVQHCHPSCLIAHYLCLQSPLLKIIILM